ncbi:hypothetical protein AGMMS49959_19270 [Planctomycetales bacterium]|nr:hypothetical protein AGMMS49959_19270 [Planctomycetales bacterium]
MLFFWLRSADLARERVRSRVAEGGHDIPPEVIARRYVSGIKNLFALYVPLVDATMIYDNTDGRKELIAANKGEWHIFDRKKFDLMKESL